MFGGRKDTTHLSMSTKERHTDGKFFLRALGGVTMWERYKKFKTRGPGSPPPPP